MSIRHYRPSNSIYSTCFGLLSEFKVLGWHGGQLQQSRSGTQTRVLSVLTVERIWIFLFIRMIPEHLSQEKAWAQNYDFSGEVRAGGRHKLGFRQSGRPRMLHPLPQEGSRVLRGLKQSFLNASRLNLMHHSLAKA